jgi:hypothetical protein
MATFPDEMTIGTYFNHSGGYLFGKRDQGKSHPGSYKFEGDKLHLCVGESVRQNAEDPQIVRQNAEDPAGLEILSWGEKQPGTQGNHYRSVNFRCALVGHAFAGFARVGHGQIAPRKAGPPVLRETATLEYQGAALVRVRLSRTQRTWEPQP